VIENQFKPLLYLIGCRTLYGKGPHYPLRAGSQRAHGQITIIGMSNSYPKS